MIARRFGHRSVLPAFCGALMALLVVAGPVSAQFGEAAGIAEAMTPDVMSRDIVTFTKGLDLDETQRVIIEALFNDYNDAFEASVDKMKSRFEDMRKDLVQEDPRRVLALVFTPFSELGQAKAKNYEQFISNVKIILTPEQMTKWPAFERQLLREKELSKGRLSGESIDLFTVLRDMHLDDAVTASAQPVLEQYSLEMDRALQDRRAVRAKIQPDMLKAMSEQDGKTSIELFDRMIAKQVAVRNVNDKYIDAIALALPSEQGKSFRQSALERAYPRVYRETPVERLYVNALELEGLSAETLTAITDLQHSFLSELEPMNEGLLRELRDWDPQEQKQQAANFASHWQGPAAERKEDPTRDSFLKRDALAKRYAKSLQAVLTPEQFGLLPGSYRWLTDEETVKPKAKPNTDLVPRDNPVSVPGDAGAGSSDIAPTKSGPSGGANSNGRNRGRGGGS